MAQKVLVFTIDDKEYSIKFVDNEKLYYCGRDVCDVLGHSYDALFFQVHTYDKCAFRDICKPTKQMSFADTRDMYITKTGLEHLVMKSRASDEIVQKLVQECGLEIGYVIEEDEDEPTQIRICGYDVDVYFPLR